uniref:Fibrinogen beta chain n=1 Tax=Periophthalmus magnuspinnatus TaxID=409849 RepID=A0A3B3ZQN6_9GOBI
NTATVDARGHRPLTRGRELYLSSRYNPPPIIYLVLFVLSRYSGRPSTTTVTGPQQQEKVEQPESGGCTHAMDEMGVLCPNGCELKTMLQKQERSVRISLNSLRPQVEELSRESNQVFNYVKSMSTNLRERQRVINNNNDVVGQYTDRVEEQHAYIKETVDTHLPSTIRVLQGVLDKVRLKIQKLEKAIQTQTQSCQEPCKTKCPVPVVSGKECEDIFRRGGLESQMYLVRPDPSSAPYRVYCDQQTQNGGWLVIQNRLDGSVDFGRRWDDYRKGFGNIALDVGKGHCQTPGEYWLGNDRISQISKMGPTTLLVEMEDWSGTKVQPKLKPNSILTQLKLNSDSTNYVLAVDVYSGTAGNCLLEGSTELIGINRTMTIHNGMMFKRLPLNPGDPSKQCSREDGGGWWYNRCHSANPNGRYYMGGAYTKLMAKHGTDDGMVWMNWKGSWYSLKAISMKIRPFFQS